MTLSASRVADVLERTAKLLDEHGADTTRIVAEWTGAGSAAVGGRSSEGAYADPTEREALSERPPANIRGIELATLNARWLTALGSIVRIYVRLNGAHPKAIGHGAEGPMLRRIARAIRPRPDTPIGLLTELDHLCLEVTKIIGWTHPMTPEQARELLFEKSKLANQASYCRACERPGPTKSALCPQDYELQRHHVNNGRPDLADLGAFSAYIRSRMAAGELVRDGSRHMPDKLPRIHAPVAFVCPNCHARQTVTGSPGVVGCVECGTAMVEAA